MRHGTLKTHQRFAFGAAVVILLISVIAGGAMIQRTLEEKTIVVKSKERLMSVSSTDGDTKTTFKNFVYSENETYRIKDSFWNWHFRAGTVYAQIPDDGGECDVVLSGIRAGFFSMYQNIISADCN